MTWIDVWHGLSDWEHEQAARDFLRALDEFQSLQRRARLLADRMGSCGNPMCCPLGTWWR